MNFLSLLTLAVALTVAGCSKDEAPAAPPLRSAPAVATPASALQSIGDAVRANDVDGLLRATLTKSTYDSYKVALQARADTSEHERQMFVGMLAQISGPAAIDNALAQLEPMLPMLKPQLQSGIAMLRKRAGSEPLPTTQQTQLSALLDGMSDWANSNNFDAAQLRLALTALQDAIAATEITTLDELQALSYEQKMVKAGVVLAGLKQALVHFNLDLDAIAGSLSTQLISESGDSATVRSSLTVFGAKLEGEVEMFRADGNWYPQASRVAVNAYNDYVARAHVSEAVAAAGATKTALHEYFASMGVMPPAGQFDTSEGRYTQSTRHDESGIITVTLRDADPVNSMVRAYQLTLTPQFNDSGDELSHWVCAPVGELSSKFLPRHCQE